MNRNRLLAGGAIGFLVILIVLGLILLRRELQLQQAQVNQREPLQGLAYCDSRQIAPCIISFSRDADDKMLINVLTRGTSFPDFYLKIKHSQGESIYPCTEVEQFSTSVYCSGKVLPLGEVLQFFILSIDDNHLLAQGNFSIIGMAYSTLDIFAAPTLGEGTPSAPATTSLTEEFSTLTLMPTSSRVTPTQTPTRTPSYPNPSTSTPSYPNPKP